MSEIAFSGLRRPLDVILRERSDARRAKLRPQVDLLLERMREVGVEGLIVGSYARESCLFEDGSDVDVLILSSGDLRDADLWRLAWEAIRDAPADLVFARDLSEAQIVAMKEHARE